MNMDSNDNKKLEYTIHSYSSFSSSYLPEWVTTSLSGIRWIFINCRRNNFSGIFETIIRKIRFRDGAAKPSKTKVPATCYQALNIFVFQHTNSIHHVKAFKAFDSEIYFIWKVRKFRDLKTWQRVLKPFLFQIRESARLQPQEVSHYGWNGCEKSNSNVWRVRKENLR